MLFSAPKPERQCVDVTVHPARIKLLLRFSVAMNFHA